ncbi:MAG: hypothetical protein ACYS18_04290 [Planctomycetota bacterium]|jgi:hypothetical protein
MAANRMDDNFDKALGKALKSHKVTSANAAVDFTELMGTSINKVSETVTLIVSQWQSYIVFVVALGFVLYSFIRFHVVDT